MKKIYSMIMLLSMMVASFSLTACGSGSDSDLIGKWKVKSDLDISKVVYMQFNSDGTYIESTNKDDETKGTWSLKESVITLTNELGAFEYEIKEKGNGKMTVLMKGFEITLNFEKLKE